MGCIICLVALMIDAELVTQHCCNFHSVLILVVIFDVKISTLSMLCGFWAGWSSCSLLSDTCSADSCGMLSSSAAHCKHVHVFKRVNKQILIVLDAIAKRILFSRKSRFRQKKLLLFYEDSRGNLALLIESSTIKGGVQVHFQLVLFHCKGYPNYMHNLHMVLSIRRQNFVPMLRSHDFCVFSFLA